MDQYQRLSAHIEFEKAGKGVDIFDHPGSEFLSFVMKILVADTVLSEKGFHLFQSPDASVGFPEPSAWLLPVLLHQKIPHHQFMISFQQEYVVRMLPDKLVDLHCFFSAVVAVSQNI